MSIGSRSTPPTGQIRVGADADMDFEGIQNSFSVVVSATTTAGMSASVDVTIDIIDINLGPYDVDHNEQIDMKRALAAARDYFDDMIEMAETTRVVPPLPVPTRRAMTNAWM